MQLEQSEGLKEYRQGCNPPAWMTNKKSPEGATDNQQYGSVTLSGFWFSMLFVQGVYTPACGMPSPLGDFFFNVLSLRAKRLHVEGVILQPKTTKTG